jgi:uncharacterized protein
MFNSAVQEAIGYYVYRLIDPRTGETFYVGKGVGNRLFAHVAESDRDLDRKTHKLTTISAIKKAGLGVQYLIHRHGLTEKEAFEVEAALLDAYDGLSNVQGGTHNAQRGAMTSQEIIGLYDAKPAEITEPVVLIKISREWHRGIGADALYERTRRFWVCNPMIHDAKYAMSVCSGLIRQVYEIHEWYPQTVTEDAIDPTRKGKGKLTLKRRDRWAFNGEVAQDMQEYVGKTVDHLQSQGNQNPIRWVNC